MIYLARIVYLIGALICFAGIGGIFLFYGRRGQGLIDMPEFVPMSFAALGVGFLICVGAVLCGADLGPMGKANARRAHAKAVRAQAIKASGPPARGMTRAAYNNEIVRRHLEGDESISVDMFDDAVHGRLRQPDLPNDEKVMAAAADAIDLAAAPCRLDIMVPPGHSDSWVGGRPRLPENVAWPEGDGHPLAFLAQIALHELPPNTWGGLGPRQGWIALFAPLDHHGDVTIIHMEALGPERALPAGLHYKYLNMDTFEQQALRMMGDAALQPPRWPVRIVPTDLDPHPAERGLNFAVHDTADLSNPGWQPFDWQTMRALIDSALRFVDKEITPAGTPRNANTAAAQQMSRESALALRPDLERLENAVSNLSQGDYDWNLHTTIMTTLRGLKIAMPRMGGDEVAGQTYLISLLNKVVAQDYGKLFELRARHVYCANPFDLPAANRDLLEPIWQKAAQDEVIGLGGSGEKFEHYDAAILLELVPSHLFGWTFGDWSNYAIMVRRDDIFRGDLSKAFNVDNHGI